MSERPWQFWSSQQIAAATGASVEAVETNWPHVEYALHELGIADRPVQVAAIGTIAVETGSTFRPIHEYQPWPDHYDGGPRYHGRGYIQLTHRYNYLTYGDLLGVDLVNDPDRALDPSVSAWVLAHYFKNRGVADAARGGDWAEVRRRVQGAYAGLERLQSIVAALEAAETPESPPDAPEPDSNVAVLLATVVENARAMIGRPYVWGGDGLTGFDCSGFVKWAYDTVGVGLPRHSDAQWNACDEITEGILPGDIVGYFYDDQSQPGVRVPHIGLVISEELQLDARGVVGVGVRPYLAGRDRRFGRVRGLAAPVVPAPPINADELLHAIRTMGDVVGDRLEVHARALAALRVRKAERLRLATAVLNDADELHRIRSQYAGDRS